MMQYLPEIYLLLLGFTVFMYAVLDGYDLGVGILLPLSGKSQSRPQRSLGSVL
ncbi:Cytochrome d ubiquinol oxidase subunit II [Vibrio cholerae]|nr:Cytochrome d ubiquinol oxidase subunit II [Vibrio cholerae]